MYKTTIIGNLGQDAVYKDFNGTKYISFSVAHSERYKDNDGQPVEKTTWFSCLKKGESTLIQYLRKGSTVYLEGTPTHRIYTQNGTTQIGHNINVTRIELIHVKETSENTN